MSENEAEKPKVPLWRIIFILVMQLIVMKTVILLFGARYAEFPGEGYGYGLAASVITTLIMVGFFVWKYRNHDF